RSCGDRGGGRLAVARRSMPHRHVVAIQPPLRSATIASRPRGPARPTLQTFHQIRAHLPIPPGRGEPAARKSALVLAFLLRAAPGAGPRPLRCSHHKSAPLANPPIKRSSNHRVDLPQRRIDLPLPCADLPLASGLTLVTLP